MYAIVKTGGKQYKVAEGDVIEIEKLEGEPGAAVTLPVVLVVDGSELTTSAEALRVGVTTVPGAGCALFVSHGVPALSVVVGVSRWRRRTC